MRKYFTDYQCIMILKRCVERVALLGRGRGRGQLGTGEGPLTYRGISVITPLRFVGGEGGGS